MLHEFIDSNRAEVIRRCRAKLSARFASDEIPELVDHGVPVFLEELVRTLAAEQRTTIRPAGDDPKIGRDAALHGLEMLRLGFRIDQVVHHYGDICQSVTEMAVEQDVPFSADEFRTLNRCLDCAIADAVSAFGSARADSVCDEADALLEVQRRLLDMAAKAFSSIKTGNIGVNGATGAVLGNVIYELLDLIDRRRPAPPPAAG